MHNHEKDKRFILIMAALGEASGQEPTDFKVKIYAKGLEDIPIEAIEEAAWSLIRGRTLASFPKVGELREYFGGGKADDLAIIALDKLEKAMRIHGKYRSIVFDDPIIHSVVYSMGGWPKICSMEQDEWKWARKDFEKIYKTFSSSAPTETPLRLAGIMEKENSTKGFDIPLKIAYAGDQQKALGWTAKLESKPAIDRRVTEIAKLLGQPAAGKDDNDHESQKRPYCNATNLILR